MKHLVSIVVPVYNVEQYLNDCLASIVNQTYQSIEIILVDDGSSDGSLFLCNQWAKRDKRIRVVANSHGGASNTRNTGVKYSSGDLVGFVDSDDYIEPQYVEKLVEILEKNPDCAISTCCIQKYIDGKIEPFSESWQFIGIRFIEPDEFAERLMLMKSQHSSCGKLFKREILEAIHFRNGVSNEDILFYFDLFPFVEAQKIRTVEISDTLYYYRMRPGSTCYGKNVKMVVAENINMRLFLAATKDVRPNIYNYYYKTYLENNLFLINKYLTGSSLEINPHEIWKSLKKYPNRYVRGKKAEIPYDRFIFYKYFFPVAWILYRIKMFFKQEAS